MTLIYKLKQLQLKSAILKKKKLSSHVHVLFLVSSAATDVYEYDQTKAFFFLPPLGV